MSPAKKSADLVILAKWIAPVVPAGRLLEDCALIVEKGRILDICSHKMALAQFDAAEQIDLPHHLVTPGLVNCHGHAAMSLLRGYADDLPLKQWLEEHIWPAEGQHVSFDFVYDGTRLAMAEMLRYGTSCFSDMYFFPDAAAKAVHEAGMRAQITFPVIDFPTPWAGSEDEYFTKGLKLHDNFRNNPRIAIAFGPHAPYTVNDKALARVATLASELDAGIQIHCHETVFEVESAADERPLKRLARLGVLGPKTQLVHMTQVSDDDLALLKQWQCHVVHCPESNMKLASGICPAPLLIEQGVNVALGTDGCASNNDLNMAGEMKTAALLAKVSSGDPTVLGAHQNLALATLGGAKALGLQDDIGSLETGKLADIAAFPMHDLLAQPCFDPVSHLIYNDACHRADHVWVAGQQLLRNGQCLTLDIAALHARANHWRNTLNTGRKP